MMNRIFLIKKKYNYYSIFFIFIFVFFVSFLYKDTALADHVLCSVGWHNPPLIDTVTYDQNGGSLGDEDPFSTTPICNSGFGVDPCTGLSTAVICQVSRPIQSCVRTIRSCNLDTPIFGITTKSELVSQNCSSAVQYQQTCSPQGQGCQSHASCNVDANGVPNGTSCLVCEYYGNQTTTKACQVNPNAPSSCTSPGNGGNSGGNSCSIDLTSNGNVSPSFQQGSSGQIQFRVSSNDGNSHAFTTSISGCNRGLICSSPSSSGATVAANSVYQGAYNINTSSAETGTYNLTITATKTDGTSCSKSFNANPVVIASRQLVCDGGQHAIPGFFTTNRPLAGKYYTSLNSSAGAHVSVVGLSDSGPYNGNPGNVMEQRCTGGSSTQNCMWQQDWDYANDFTHSVVNGPKWFLEYNGSNYFWASGNNGIFSDGDIFLGEFNSKKTVWARPSGGSVMRKVEGGSWVVDSGDTSSFAWNTSETNNPQKNTTDANGNSYQFVFQRGNPRAGTQSGVFYSCSGGLGGSISVNPSGNVPYGTASTNVTWSSIGAKVCGVYVQRSGVSTLGYPMGAGFEYRSSNILGNNIPYNNLSGPTGAFNNIGNNLVMQLYCSPNVDGSNASIVANASISQIIPPPATVDIKVNNSDGPTINLNSGQDVPLTWSYSGATSCAISAPASISGYPSGSGSVQTGPLASPGRTYSINCTNAMGVNSSDQVVVNIPAPMSLTVIKSGQGSVTSSPAGISCLAGCPSQTYSNFIQNQVVVLTAAPAAGRVFTGWITSDGTSCPINAGKTCTVTMNQGKTVTANFVVDPNYREF